MESKLAGIGLLARALKYVYVNALALARRTQLAL
jgi:hypothetical protein